MEIFLTIVILWATIIVVNILIEVFTVNIYTGITAVSFVPSLLLAIFLRTDWSIYLQIASAIVFWFIIYFSLYKLLVKWANKSSGKYKSSVEDFIGQETELLEDSYEVDQIPNPYGKLYIGNKYFRTLSDRKQNMIPKGTQVKVTKIIGNTFYVERIER